MDIKINYDSILELSYEMSRIDTFVEEIYNSNCNFFNSVLENAQLTDLHEKILKNFEHFKYAHKNRQFTTLSEESV